MITGAVTTCSEVFCTVWDSQIVFFVLSAFLNNRGDKSERPLCVSPGRRFAPGGEGFYRGVNFEALVKRPLPQGACDRPGEVGRGRLPSTDLFRFFDSRIDDSNELCDHLLTSPLSSMQRLNDVPEDRPTEITARM